MFYNFTLIFFLFISGFVKAFDYKLCDGLLYDVSYKQRGFRGHVYAEKCKLNEGIIYDYESSILSSFVEKSNVDGLHKQVSTLKIRGDSYELINEAMIRKYKLNNKKGFEYDILVSSIYEHLDYAGAEKSRLRISENCFVVESHSNEADNGTLFLIIKFINSSKSLFSKNINSVLINNYRITSFIAKGAIGKGILSDICNQNESYWNKHVLEHRM
ncbi:hypothetical protein CWB99_08570 [Pseudoalteromonas rubra]|uniref:Uncharacterized protein n=1 Tax=Pseudoalteromonas rubra TaxID=43658 RepID=A0A5S3WNQ7_9GAMM|nr:hypothetical protein [Pseudoalteromonas rubra]TMP29644.1 hypothetical protein CWB99_08570 [Pseudoalteromonas rubra]TMP35237.1 hypothetical protein CWC00_05535 [Pseudoalteromonas rubra]